MTDEERNKAIEKANKAKKAEIETRKAAEIEAGFLNPFGESTSYAEFLAQVNESKKSVSEYCKGKISEEQLEWLQRELSILKK